MRGSKVEVTCPKFWSAVLMLTPLNCVWLKVLNVSTRNSNFTRSVIVKVLYRDMLKLINPGPTTASLLALPKPEFGPPFHGAMGFAKELVLNQAFTVFGYVTGAIWLGRFLPPASPSTSGP